MATDAKKMWFEIARAGYVGITWAELVKRTNAANPRQAMYLMRKLKQVTQNPDGAYVIEDFNTAPKGISIREMHEIVASRGRITRWIEKQGTAS